ncbi:hypothetical protein K438DRAFT_1777198 [Mycena galopus ATCC 62051]|nr:hypothetical protein K438DRAFT_1777198 [Mycena galopus ATCC 62051]
MESVGWASPKLPLGFIRSQWNAIASTEKEQLLRPLVSTGSRHGESSPLDSSGVTVLGNGCRHQPVPNNADQPVPSSAYITGRCGVLVIYAAVETALAGIIRHRLPADPNTTSTGFQWQTAPKVLHCINEHQA